MANTHESDAISAGDRAMLGKYLITMFVAGPTLGLIGLALPHAPDADTLALAVVACTGYPIAAVLALFRHRIPTLGYEIAAATGSVLISTSIYFSGSGVTTGAFYYLWVILGAAYFLSRTQVAAQLVIMAVGYAAALILKEPQGPGMVQAWIVATGTLTIAATLMVLTREHVARLVARLAEAADTDALTELLNRRGFNRQLELELERARRSGTEVSLITGDLDHFKQVNDSFGHQTGDEVLVQIGEVLKRHARRIDSVARIGGEEFALLLPTADARGAYVSAERLRHRVREAVSTRHPGLTISFGVASYPADGESAERLLRCADESLYAAKTLGRDRTVIYSREVVGALATGPEGESGNGAANLTTLLILAEALDLRDERTARHSETVGRYAAAMARELGFEPDRVERVRLAGVLHDIGNIGVADSILYESGPLTDEEWAEIRTHPETGARLLSAPGMGDLRAWVLAHHERMDGTGYPLGLSGDTIPIEARIIAVADAFEGMLGDRPHRSGRRPDEALAVLRRYGGTQFDPDVVAALAACLDTIVDQAPAPARS
jgi:diguanylate cyclase (GGDEF)-like protein